MAVNVIHDVDPQNQITHDYIRTHNHYEAVTITFTEDKVEYDVKANTALFTRINWAREWYLKTDTDILVKLNAITNNGIDVWSYETLNSTGYPVENFFINAPSGTKVRITIYGWN